MFKECVLCNYVDCSCPCVVCDYVDCLGPHVPRQFWRDMYLKRSRDSINPRCNTCLKRQVHGVPMELKAFIKCVKCNKIVMYFCETSCKEMYEEKYPILIQEALTHCDCKRHGNEACAADVNVK